MSTGQPSGKAKGGLKRAEVLSPEEMKAIAHKGAIARWGAKATHKGNFKEEFGTDVECYVLNDATRTAVISQTGMGKAIGLSERGNALPRFLASKAMTEALGAQLSDKLNNPLIFQWRSRGAQASYGVTIYGYDATILVDLCKAILNAEASGKLHPQQRVVARQAAIIMGASAKSGIKGLVYALAGYSPTTEEVIQAFKLYVREEAKKYEQEFPNELYVAWHKLYAIPVPVRGKPWHFKHLTIRHIYYPLASSNGRILELIRALKSKGGDRQKKLFQFLNDVGARALRMQIGRVLEMSESSNTPQEYEAKIVSRFGGQQELDLVVPTNPSAA